MSNEAVLAVDEEQAQTSLNVAAARNLATTTKSRPQMQGISSRWLLRKLPWVGVDGGVYRVNRRLTYAVGRGRVSFFKTGADVRVVPPSLREVPALRGFDDEAVLAELAGRFAQREFRAGDVLVEAGRPIDEILLIAHGKVDKARAGDYDAPASLGVLADGDHLGEEALAGADPAWTYTATAATAGVVLAVPRTAFDEIAARSQALREHMRRRGEEWRRPATHKGEADVAVASGHDGEPKLTETFVDYELSPREYELGVAQTVLRVHTRVADLYNMPMSQLEEQLRLTVEALHERQEHELVNNPRFGLLHNADASQRISTHSGPPTPDDLDDLLTRRRGTRLFLAHPLTIAAIGRECNLRGISNESDDVDGHKLMLWRGRPIFPCDKIPISETGLTSILAMRTGEDNQGVIGIRPGALPDEVEPGVNVRFMGVNEKAVTSYLVSAYQSAVVMLPDALGVLENVEIGAFGRNGRRQTTAN